jgi:hypothetical protein
LELFPGNESGTTTRLLAGLFESVVSIVDQHGDDLTHSFGDAAVQAVVQSLNKECDICGAQLLKRYIDQRNILQIAKDVSLRTKKQGDNNVDPRYVEKIKVLSLKRTDFKGDAEMSNSRIELVMSLPPSLPTHRLIEEYLVRGELFPSAQIKDERKKK